jgi:translation initiation factor 1
MSKLIKKEEPNIIYSSDGSHKKQQKVVYAEIKPESITIELQRVKAKRGGKFVIVLSNLPNNPEYFKDLCKKLKKACACGGTYKKGTIEIQGDKADKVTMFLEQIGFSVKKIGG